jgi:hypothetical protein
VEREERIDVGVRPELSGTASLPSTRTNSSTDLHLDALGSTFVVTCGSADEAALLERQWSRLGADLSAVSTSIAIDLRSVPPDQQGRALLSQLTIRAIEAAAGTRLMFHAAGIADADGRVVALVGPSAMGKTTASVYLSRHGFGYVTDETVSIGPDGGVLPFGRPLSLRRLGGEVQRSPDELGLSRPSGDLSIARIVLLDRVPDHARAPTLTAVPLVDALLELIPHASALAKLPDPLQLMSRVIERCGGALRLTYAEMDERVLTVLSQLLGREVDACDAWQPCVAERPTAAALSVREPGPVDGSTLFQGSVLDGVTTGEEALFLVDDIPVRLGGIGLAIWDAARDGVEQGKIVSIVEQAHGPHPDAPGLVCEAVDRMLRSGLLVVRSDDRAIAPATSR